MKNTIKLLETEISKVAADVEIYGEMITSTRKIIAEGANFQWKRGLNNALKRQAVKQIYLKELQSELEKVRKIS